jgi:hypothetical protein
MLNNLLIQQPIPIGLPFTYHHEMMPHEGVSNENQNEK